MKVKFPSSDATSALVINFVKAKYYLAVLALVLVVQFIYFDRSPLDKSTDVISSRGYKSPNFEEETHTRSNSAVDNTAFKMLGKPRVEKKKVVTKVLAPETRLNLSLHGVIDPLVNSGSAAAIIRVENKDQKLIYVGENITRDVVLDQVFPGYVILLRGSAKERLVFEEIALPPQLIAANKSAEANEVAGADLSSSDKNLTALSRGIDDSTANGTVQTVVADAIPSVPQQKSSNQRVSSQRASNQGTANAAKPIVRNGLVINPPTPRRKSRASIVGRSEGASSGAGI